MSRLELRDFEMKEQTNTASWFVRSTWNGWSASMSRSHMHVGIATEDHSPLKWGILENMKSSALGHWCELAWMIAAPYNPVLGRRLAFQLSPDIYGVEILLNFTGICLGSGWAIGVLLIYSWFKFWIFLVSKELGYSWSKETWSEIYARLGKLGSQRRVIEESLGARRLKIKCCLRIDSMWKQGLGWWESRWLRRLSVKTIWVRY